MQQLIEWWNNISLREQTMVALLAFIGGLASFYFFAYQPVMQTYQQSQQRLASSYENYRWLQKQLQSIEELRNQNRGVLPALLSLSQLEELVRQQLEERNIEARIEVIDSVNDSDEGALKIEVSGAAVEVMKWLEQLVNSGHQISMINLQNADNWLSGVVSVKT